MDTPALTTYIVDRLSDSINPDDIVLEICERSGMSWPEAEALVKEVQAERGQEVARKQFPLLAFVALAIFIGGIALLGYSLYMLFMVTNTYASNVMGPWELSNLLNFIFNYAELTFSILLVAIAMILGSLLGMKDAWAAILNL
jgi:hypothetical protein